MEAAPLVNLSYSDIFHPSWELGKPATPSFARHKDAFDHSIKPMGYVLDDMVSLNSKS